MPVSIEGQGGSEMAGPEGRVCTPFSPQNGWPLTSVIVLPAVLAMALVISALAMALAIVLATALATALMLITPPRLHPALLSKHSRLQH